jgi:predicted PurR-regulated permease PerM
LQPWKRAVTASRIFTTGIWFVTAAAIVFAVLSVRNPLALFENGTASPAASSTPKIAVVSVVILAFGLIFATGSLLASQLTQLAGDLPRYQSTISEKIQSFRETTAGRGTLERASGMLKDLSKELDKPNATARTAVATAPSSATSSSEVRALNGC